MSTIKTVNVIHPSGVTNNIVTDASGNVAVGGALTVAGVAAVAVAPGTSGNVLTSDGTAWTSATAPVINVQTFDASGTWTKPAGYAAGSRVYIQAWGGGGSGSRYTTLVRCAGGGGGGYNERWITLSNAGATETVTIGAGGASRTGLDQSGAQGGNTSFGALITAYGGGSGGGFVSGLPAGHGGGGGGQLSQGSGASEGQSYPGLPLFLTTQITVGCTTYYLFQGSGTANYLGQDALIHGGGGGAGSATAGNSKGRASVSGGGGGGGYNNGVGGVSSFGGNGGAGGATGVAGSQPGGGGGSGTTTSGAGGDGRVIITVFPA